MNEHDFQHIARQAVSDYVHAHLDKSDFPPLINVYIVWMCKTLQNNKALLSTDMYDGMYYEVTYNGDKHELYLDAYKKFENKKIEVEDGAERE